MTVRPRGRIASSPLPCPPPPFPIHLEPGLPSHVPAGHCRGLKAPARAPFGTLSAGGWVRRFWMQPRPDPCSPCPCPSPHKQPRPLRDAGHVRTRASGATGGSRWDYPLPLTARLLEPPGAYGALLLWEILVATGLLTSQKEGGLARPGPGHPPPRPPRHRGLVREFHMPLQALGKAAGPVRCEGGPTAVGSTSEADSDARARVWEGCGAPSLPLRQNGGRDRPRAQQKRPQRRWDTQTTIQCPLGLRPANLRVAVRSIGGFGPGGSIQWGCHGGVPVVRLKTGTVAVQTAHERPQPPIAARRCRAVPCLSAVRLARPPPGPRVGARAGPPFPRNPHDSAQSRKSSPDRR